MNTLPLVSVIIPTYNRPDFLLRAVKSVIEQTYTSIEIIVVDDNSTINLDILTKEFPEVTLLVNKKNMGGPYSRNRGLNHAKGFYINFLDDDDILYPEKIARQVKQFEISNIDRLGMITCHTMDGRSGNERVHRNHHRGNIYKLLLETFAISGIETVLYRKDYLQQIEGFDESLRSSQEYDLLIRYAEFFSIDFVDEVLTQEYRSIDQISLNFQKKIDGAIQLFTKHDQRYKNQGLFFWLKMRLKLYVLLIRFNAGKLFGERFYQFLIRN